MRVRKQKEQGFTLIEAAVIILLLSIAIIPVVRLASSSGGDASGTGIMTGVSAGQNLSKEQAVANTIMEKALAGDYTAIENPVIASQSGSAGEDIGDVLGFDINGNYCYMDDDGTALGSYNAKAGVNSNVGSPAAGQDPSHRRFVTPKYLYDQDIYYSWVIEDETYKPVDPENLSLGYKSYMPEGNGLVKVTLKVYTGDDAETSGVADYSIGSYFFKNTDKSLNSGDDFDSTIGVVLVLDVSRSMRLANFITTNTGVGTVFTQDLDYLDPNETGLAADVSWVDPTSIKSFTDSYVAGKKPYANIAGVANMNTGRQLPMRMSSGLSGYDPAAVASPYLVWRSGENDLFFGKAEDNTLTPYDERYNPCVTSTSIAAGHEEDIPYGFSGPLTTNLGTTCGASLPTIPNNDTIHVPIPSVPANTVKTALQTSLGITIASEEDMKDVFGATECVHYQGTETMNSPAATCVQYRTNGQAVDMSSPYGTPDQVIMIDWQLQRWLAANLMNHMGDTNVQNKTLSRIESARTAMLAFVQTIEENADLSDKFRIGLVPFSSEVLNGGYIESGITVPNEVVSLNEDFSGLTSTLYRVNRACKFNGGDYGGATIPNCSAGKQPLTLVGGTNIAHALLNAKKLMDDYESNSGETLDTKMIVLLTDGSPNKTADSATGSTYTASAATEAARIKSIVEGMNDITIYSIGLLCERDTTAKNVLDGIGSVGDNSTVYVSSVADLTPVFESIANQAEMLLLKSLQERYKWLDY